MEEKEKEKEKRKIVEFDPNEIHEGSCRVYTSFSDAKVRIAICKEKGKIKIYPVEKEE